MIIETRGLGMDPKIIASLLIILGTVSGQNDPITEVFDQIFYLHSQFEGKFVVKLVSKVDEKVEL